jgi:TP901 family phage tail tape measure protein
VAIELGVGYLTVLPDASKLAPGLRKAILDFDPTAPAKEQGKKYSQGFKAGINKLAAPAAAAVAGLGAIIGSSVKLEKQFSQTMNVAAATMGAPQREMAKLQALALDLGAKTSFSANEAADAMLELAKGGLSAATIQAGALEGTLTLAAAGGTSLASAAAIASNALNTFKIEGKDMATVAAALAGGANASTASVESLGQALAQVGPGAVNAGLDLHETIGALAAFDNAGIKGSDAGTSLKTMLQRLVPQTERASKAMRKAGLDFVDSEGNFVSLTNMAQQLRDSLADLTESERTQALNDIFGSDASRAASVLMQEGAEGVRKYIDATMDLGAAESAAEARMAGTAGALERLSGAWETFRLKLGLAVGPAIVWVSDKLGGLLDFLGRHEKTVLIVGGVIAALSLIVLGLAAAAAVATIATAAWGAAVAIATSPITLIILGIGLLIGAFVLLYKKNETARRIMDAAWSGIKTAISAVVDWLVGTAWPFIQKVWDGIVVGARWLWTALKVVFVAVATAAALGFKAIMWGWNTFGRPVFDWVVKAAKNVWSWLGEHIFPGLATAWRWLMGEFRKLKVQVWDPLWRGIQTAASAVWNFLKAHVFPPLAKAIKGVGEAFKPIAKIVSTAWDQIKKAAAKPVNFVIETVYTNGIKKTWDDIADAVGLDLHLPSISPIKGYATGGVLPGYTPGRDVHHFTSPTGGRLALSGGEAIMRPEWTRAVGGPAAVAAMNAAARRGQAFANGGVWGWVGDAADWVADKAQVAAKVLTNPGEALGTLLRGPLKGALEGVGGGSLGKLVGALPSKVIGSLINKAKELVGTLGASEGFTGAGGGSGMGWQAMSNIVRALIPGAQITSAFRPGSRVAGYGTLSYHARGRAAGAPVLAEGRAADPLPRRPGQHVGRDPREPLRPRPLGDGERRRVVGPVRPGRLAP